MGYRSGYYPRTLITRVGKLELRVPQDRQGRSSTEVFERYQRSEKALVSALAEMYVQGVSTRKVKAITEELCGPSFSASAVSGVVKRLDEQLSQFAQRRLEEAFAYVILDARYEKVRESGSIRSRAVLVAIGIDREGRRQVLGVELANRESASSWKDFLLTLRQRGLKGVELPGQHQLFKLFRRRAHRGDPLAELHHLQAQAGQLLVNEGRAPAVKGDLLQIEILGVALDLVDDPSIVDDIAGRGRDHPFPAPDLVGNPSAAGAFAHVLVRDEEARQHLIRLSRLERREDEDEGGNVDARAEIQAAVGSSAGHGGWSVRWGCRRRATCRCSASAFPPGSRR